METRKLPVLAVDEDMRDTRNSPAAGTEGDTGPHGGERFCVGSRNSRRSNRKQPDANLVNRRDPPQTSPNEQTPYSALVIPMRDAGRSREAMTYVADSTLPTHKFGCMQFGVTRNAEPPQMPVPVSMSWSYPSGRQSDRAYDRKSSRIVRGFLQRYYVGFSRTKVQFRTISSRIYIAVLTSDASDRPLLVWQGSGFGLISRAPFGALCCLWVKTDGTARSSREQGIPRVRQVLPLSGPRTNTEPEETIPTAHDAGRMVPSETVSTLPRRRRRPERPR